jgi:hypothetical protein
MNKHQVIAAVDTYEGRIKDQGVTVWAQMEGHKAFGDLNREQLLGHALYLCDSVRTLANSKNHRDKMMRHYASLQTIMSFLKLFTLNELRGHNKAPEIRG